MGRSDCVRKRSGEPEDGGTRHGRLPYFGNRKETAKRSDQSGPKWGFSTL
jgi:hypothetical protein